MGLIQQDHGSFAHGSNVIREQLSLQIYVLKNGVWFLTRRSHPRRLPFSGLRYNP
jgi:hypothetical protein